MLLAPYQAGRLEQVGSAQLFSAQLFWKAHLADSLLLRVWEVGAEQAPQTPAALPASHPPASLP